jgi:hypothetical protein
VGEVRTGGRTTGDGADQAFGQGASVRVEEVEDLLLDWVHCCGWTGYFDDRSSCGIDCGEEEV